MSVPLIVVAIWLMVLAAMWTMQERIVFQPPRLKPERAQTPLIEYVSEDGIPLFAYVVGTVTAGAPMILAFHGNADLARWFIPWATEVARRTGAVVVIPEYRGYEGIVGPPTSAGVALDARAALAAARSMVAGSSPIVYFGHSLGAAIATALAVESEPPVLILQSPFTSAREMAKRMLVPGLSLFWSAMSRIPYDNARRVRALDCPVWVAHGGRDLVIPARMGRAVFAAAKHPGRLLIVPKAGHNDVPEVGGEEYWEWLVGAVTGSSGPAAGSSDG